MEAALVAQRHEDAGMMNHERVKMRRHGTEDAAAQGYRDTG